LILDADSSILSKGTRSFLVRHGCPETVSAQKVTRTFFDSRNVELTSFVRSDGSFSDAMLTNAERTKSSIRTLSAAS
jgi:hypothetical protein